MEASEELLDIDEGVKRENITVTVVGAVMQKDFWNSPFQRYSSWDWKLQVKGSQGAKTELKINAVPLLASEKKIVKFVQKPSFPIEIDKPAITVQLAQLKLFEQEGI